MPDDKGISGRDAIEGLLARAKTPAKIAKYEAMLVGPPIPPELAYLWRAYWRLRRRKGGNGMGSNPLEWPDISEFDSRSGLGLVPWEIGVIEALDDGFMAAMAGKV